jgi:hypothetical protein
VVVLLPFKTTQRQGDVANIWFDGIHDDAPTSNGRRYGVAAERGLTSAIFCSSTPLGLWAPGREWRRITRSALAFCDLSKASNSFSVQNMNLSQGYCQQPAGSSHRQT